MNWTHFISGAMSMLAFQFLCLAILYTVAVALDKTPPDDSNNHE